MPLLDFATLPDDSRCWIFAARAPLDEVDRTRLLTVVDNFLLLWTAHGAPLTCARDFFDEHFLTVAVDERASNASGCSIDGLFKVLQGIEGGIGTKMLAGGTIFFRGPGDLVLSCSPAEFEHMSAMGEVDGSTRVFDTTLTTVGEYRTKFELPAAECWHAKLLKR